MSFNLAEKVITRKSWRTIRCSKKKAYEP